MLLAAVIATAPITHRAAPPARSHVSITFIACHPETVDRVSVIAIPSGVIVTDARMTRQHNGRETYFGRVPVGYYAVVTGVLPCSASVNVAVLPGKSRSVVLRGADELVMSAGEGALAGTVSDAEVRVVATCIGVDKEPFWYTAAVQNRAYYFDSIRSPAICNVRILLATDNSVQLAGFSTTIAPFTIVRRDGSW